jgi:hypothetical protein
MSPSNASTYTLLFEPDGSWACELLAQFSEWPTRHSEGIASTCNTTWSTTSTSTRTTKDLQNPPTRERKDNLSLISDSPSQLHHESYTPLSQLRSSKRTPHIRQRNAPGGRPAGRKLCSRTSSDNGSIRQPSCPPESPDIQVRIAIMDGKLEPSNAMISPGLPSSAIDAAHPIADTHLQPPKHRSRTPSPNCSIQHSARRSNDEECPICVQSLVHASMEQMVWCKGSCGSNLHKGCFATWKEYADRPVRCVIW